jgi:hypothetical protein
MLERLLVRVLYFSLSDINFLASAAASLASLAGFVVRFFTTGANNITEIIPTREYFTTGLSGFISIGE